MELNPLKQSENFCLSPPKLICTKDASGLTTTYHPYLQTTSASTQIPNIDHPIAKHADYQPQSQTLETYANTPK